MVQDYNTTQRVSLFFQKQILSPLELPNTVIVIYSVRTHHQHPSLPCLHPQPGTSFLHQQDTWIQELIQNTFYNNIIDVIAQIQSAQSLYPYQKTGDIEEWKIGYSAGHCQHQSNSPLFKPLVQRQFKKAKQWCQDKLLFGPYNKKKRHKQSFHISPAPITQHFIKQYFSLLQQK